MRDFVLTMRAIGRSWADGFLCHGFTTGRWIHERTLPALTEGRRRAGTTMDGYTVKADACTECIAKC